MIEIVSAVIVIVAIKLICNYLDKHNGWGCGDQWGNPFG